jgi:hypothetical protein
MRPNHDPGCGVDLAGLLQQGFAVFSVLDIDSVPENQFLVDTYGSCPLSDNDLILLITTER